MSLFFLFVQFEFTHSVGPHAGHYIVDPALVGAASVASSGREPVGDASPDRDIDARNQQLAGVSRGIGESDVLVVGVVGASAGRLRLLRTPRQIKQDAPPAEVPLSIVTFVKGTRPLRDSGEARKQLDVVRFSDAQQERWVNEGLQVLNLAIRGYRAGAPDPYAIEVTRRDARRVRVGYGTTEQVQNGLWQDALELAPPVRKRPKRTERLRPAEAVAFVLSGRATILEAEDLLLRALIDLDNRRSRAAAFQVGAALRLLGTEARSLGDHPPPALERLADDAVRAQELEAAAGARELKDAEIGALETIIDGVEAALDDWRYGGSA